MSNFQSISSQHRSPKNSAMHFRKMLERSEIIQLPGCYDTLSAILLEQAGFEAIFLSGYGVSASLFGNPDVGLTTLSETAFSCRNIVRRLNVPLIVDIDNGYGNEENVIRSVCEIENAGAAAIVLEDQVLPKKCGHSANKEVVPLESYLKKLDCALNSRRTGMCIIARTDAFPIDEAIRRARAFYAAGADVTLIDGISSIENLNRFATEVPGKKQVNLIYGGKTPLLSADELQKMGFKIVLYSTPALFATAYHLSQQMKILKRSGKLSELSEASVTFDYFQKLIETQYQNTKIRPYDETNLHLQIEY